MCRTGFIDLRPIKWSIGPSNLQGDHPMQPTPSTNPGEPVDQNDHKAGGEGKGGRKKMFEDIAVSPFVNTYLVGI